MKKLVNILFLFLVIMLLLGGCAYYYPYGYDPNSYPDNYGFIAPFYYYSPAGYYSNYPYPYAYKYDYDEYYPPSDRFYLGEKPEGYKERHFEQGERTGGEK